MVSTGREAVTAVTSKQYDLVLIDGMHTFEQVVRDLSNVLLRTHQRSVIILDDTVPDDVYSAVKDGAASYEYRKLDTAPARDGRAMFTRLCSTFTTIFRTLSTERSWARAIRKPWSGEARGSLGRRCLMTWSASRASAILSFKAI